MKNKNIIVSIFLTILFALFYSYINLTITSIILSFVYPGLSLGITLSCDIQGSHCIGDMIEPMNQSGIPIVLYLILPLLFSLTLAFFTTKLVIKLKEKSLKRNSKK